MEIRKLEKLAENATMKWGMNGYRTDKILVVSAIETGTSFEFGLREKNQYYSKVWKINPEDIDELNIMISKGYSFGAFKDNELIGWAICDFCERNNSFVIKNMLVSEQFRGQNIGKLFIKKINRKARELRCRIVEVETQNTNYNAVQFFQQAGFTITGINTKLYSDSTETALFLSFDVL